MSILLTCPLLTVPQPLTTLTDIEIIRLLYLWVYARTEHLVEYRNTDIR